MNVHRKLQEVLRFDSDFLLQKNVGAHQHYPSLDVMA